MPRLFLSLILLLVVAACASRPASVPVRVAQDAPEAFEASEYALGAGDRLRITVYGEPDLSGEFAVDGAGQVSFPLIGEITARGLTVRGFQTALAAALREGYLRDPKVAAEVVAFRPFYILGEVEKPGTYAYQNGLTVLSAVATAEGFTYRANQKVVYIRREGEQQETRYPLSSTTPVRPGDTIRIGERFF